MSHPTPRVPGGTLAAGGEGRLRCVWARSEKKRPASGLFQADGAGSSAHACMPRGEDFSDSHAGDNAHEAWQGKTSVVDGKKKERSERR